MAEEKFNSIDVFKLLMAIAVVAIHTNPIVNWSNQAAIGFVVMIEEWAVPFFFVASGFFLFYKMREPYQEDIERIDNYILKILKMYCIWTMVSLPLTIYGYITSGNGIINCILSYVKYFLFVGKLYNSYHLWYLLALIYALVVIRMLLKKSVQPIPIAVISIIVYLFAGLMSVLIEDLNELGGILYQLTDIYQFVFNKGGIFTGMIYVSIGMLISYYRLRINKWLGIAGLVVLNFLKLFMNDRGAWLVLPVEALMLFMTLLEIRLPNSRIWKKCREMSTTIYLSHLIFYSIYTFIFIKNPNKLGFDSFLVTLIFSSLYAMLLSGIKKVIMRFSILCQSLQ